MQKMASEDVLASFWNGAESKGNRNDISLYNLALVGVLVEASLGGQLLDTWPNATQAEGRDSGRMSSRRCFHCGV